MAYVLAQPQRPGFPYAAYNQQFNRNECGAILALGVALAPEMAMVGTGAAGKVDPDLRVSEVRWIHWSQHSDWLFSKLAAVVQDANARLWGFNLAGFNEALQLTRYVAPKPTRGKNKQVAGHYDWHEDHAEQGPMQHRKLSVVVPLNDGYQGGRFRMLHNEVPEQSIGTAIVFPSYKTHCVEAVTSGERWSLVGWITGPPFA